MLGAFVVLLVAVACGESQSTTSEPVDLEAYDEVTTTGELLDDEFEVPAAPDSETWEWFEAEYMKGCKAGDDSDEACQCGWDVIRELGDIDLLVEPLVTPDTDWSEAIGSMGPEGVAAFQACVGPDAMRKWRSEVSREEALEYFDLSARIGCKAGGATDKECDCHVEVIHELIPDDDIVAATRSGELATYEGNLALLERSGVTVEELVGRAAICALREKRPAGTAPAAEQGSNSQLSS